MEKSASSTTLTHGPGHDKGGVNENGLGEKSAKVKLLNSVTSQGVVSGRVTGGSAVAVLAEPMASPGGGMTCVEAVDVMNAKKAIAKMVFRRRAELASKNLRGRGSAFIGILRRSREI